MDPNPNPAPPAPTPGPSPRNENPSVIPVLRPEFIKMIPTFSGEPLLLTHFIDVCDRLYETFHDNENESFQNYFLFDSILAKITGKATDIVFSNSVTDYSELRDVLLANFSDKRDFYTLIAEMSKMTQKHNESCFDYHQRMVNLLNIMIAHLQINKIDPTKSVLIEFARGFAMRTFINGLNETTASLLRARKCESLEEVLIILQNEFNFSNQRNQQSNLFPKPNLMNRTSPMTSVNNQRPYKSPNITPNSFSTPQNVTTPHWNNNNFNQQRQNYTRPWNPNQSQNPNFQRNFSTPGPSTPRNGQQRPFQRQISYKSATSTPKNFHMIQIDDENPQEPQNQSQEESNPNSYIPGFFDGTNFYPYEFNNLGFENLTMEESPEPQEQNAPFLEEVPESGTPAPQ